MKIKALLTGSLLSAALLLSVINSAPQATAAEAAEDTPAVAAIATDCSTSRILPLAEAVSSGTTEAANLASLASPFASSATSVVPLSELGATGAVFPMHRKADCDRAYARDS